MSEFSNLPNEILIKIFEYCKVLELTVVSKRFNDVIGKSTVLMKKLNLIITQQIPELEFSRRKYQNISVKFNYKIDEGTWTEIRRHGENIKKLEMIRCIVNQHLFNDILDSLPKLEVLSLFTTFLTRNVHSNDPEANIEYQMNLPPRVKKIILRNSDTGFLKIRQKSEELKCINCKLPIYLRLRCILDFLNNHPNIEEIDNLSFGENFLQIILSLKKLKKLSLDLDNIDSNVETIEETNDSVHSLRLIRNFETPEYFSLLIGLFKGLKYLEMESNNTLTAHDMEFNRMPIESLTFIDCLVEHHRHLHIQSLKQFSIDNASNITIEDWANLAASNPNLEVLKVKDESICNEKFTTITQGMLKLKHFELFFDPQRLTPDILNFIAGIRFPLNIKILKICERNPSNQKKFQLSNIHKEVLNLRHGFQLYLG